MALFISSAGLELGFSPNNGEKFTLEELQGLVGGYIERVPMSNGKSMYVNEEGKLNGLPYNEKATQILRHQGRIPNDHIVGDVIILSNKEED